MRMKPGSECTYSTANIRASARALIKQLFESLRPPPDLSTFDWSNQRRYVAQGASATPGKFNTEVTPYMELLYDMLDAPDVPVVVAQKSAQVAWTETINNKIGKHADVDPLGCIVMFAKDGAARSFEREKLVPMIEATPVLREKINTSRSKASGNTWDYKKASNGFFIKLVTSRSPASVKSTAASLLIVEEPDDADSNVSGQGNSIKLLEDRGDTFENSKIVFGGTPTIKGLSQVEAGYSKSDQRVYMVPCHECGESHELDFEYLLCREFDDGYEHEVYGKLDPSTAYYACPKCGCTWDDWQKNRNVADAKEFHDKGWMARQRSNIPGFRFNALMSPFPGARFAKLMAKKLEALHKLAQGDDTDWIAFVNTRMGQPYEFGNSNLDVDALKEKALDYQEGTVPAGGLILTAGIDVQHDRIHMLIRAWGRNEQSWLVTRVVLYGATSQISDPVWTELDKHLFCPYPHVSGAQLLTSAASIDASDGTNNDSVYAWVAKHQGRGVMAINGANTYDAPLYRVPPPLSKQRKKATRAESYGVQIWRVGTTKAKDMIIGTSEKTGRLRLTSGAGAMFWYASVSDEYYAELLGEVKAPHRNLKGKLVWQQKAGCPVEDLDCEVYNLHASRRARVHLMSNAQWDEYEAGIMQTDLFSGSSAEDDDEEVQSVYGGV